MQTDSNFFARLDNLANEAEAFIMDKLVRERDIALFAIPADPQARQEMDFSEFPDFIHEAGNGQFQCVAVGRLRMVQDDRAEISGITRDSARKEVSVFLSEVEWADVILLAYYLDGD